MINHNEDNQPQIDDLAEEVSEVLREVENVVPRNPNDGIARDLQSVFQNQEYRQALVRLYKVLLEVDMRNNPEAYITKK